MGIIIGIEGLWMCNDCEKTFVISKDAKYHANQTRHYVEKMGLKAKEVDVAAKIIPQSAKMADANQPKEP
jgi:hypothetical protein